MTLEGWLKTKLIVEHESSSQEIRELLDIVLTDLSDARIPELSPDRRMSCCYAALLTAARTALRASGYRVPKSNTSHHYYAIQSLQFTAGIDSNVIRQIESMGKKRATADYVRVGEISDSMVSTALAFAEDYCQMIEDWIRAEHPRLMVEQI